MIGAARKAGLSLRRLPKQTRALNTVSDIARETAAPVAQPSLLERIFGKSATPSVPLDQPFQSTPVSYPKTLEPVDQKANVTTLSNGLRVASVPSNSGIRTVGVFIDAGSRYENAAFGGISHFIEQAAFKSTKHRSGFMMIRELAKLGINVQSSTSREVTSFFGESLPEFQEELVNTLADITQFQSFTHYDMIEARNEYKAGLKDLVGNPEQEISEGLHRAAFSSQGLGLPLFAPEENLENFTSDILQEYVQTFYTPKRMVLVGLGVDHEELTALGEEAFQYLPNDQDITTQKTTYTGGEWRNHGKSADGLTHVALGFQSANWHDADLVPMCVLQSIMGGGGSFSAGGPGKGMYSRLYENVLNRHGFTHSAHAFASIYTDESVFGFSATAHPEDAGHVVDVLVQEAQRMKGKVDPTELSRAKNALKGGMFAQVENRSLLLDDIGRQVLTYGKVSSTDELAAQIDAVQEKDIVRVATKMLGTVPTFTSYGDATHLPRFSVIEKALQ